MDRCPQFARRRVLLGAGLATLATGAGLSSWAFHANDEADANLAASILPSIQARAHVLVLMDDLQSRVGPFVVLPDRPVRMKDLDRQRLNPLRGLEDSLSPYPDGFVARFIDVVALAGDVTFWKDTRVGGFFFPRGLCINAGGSIAPASVAQIFHHELSSLVRLVFPFDVAQWERCNPPDFHYLDEAAYRNILKNGVGHQPGGPALFQRGFVRPYGLSDIDDDWNTYAEAVFGDGQRFAELIRAYPRMQAKTAMLVKVYAAADPRIMAYFRSMGIVG